MTRRFTRWAPSVGFVLIIASLAGVVAFVVWIAGEDWYDRLGKPMNQKMSTVMLTNYSDYLETIAPRTRRKGKGIEEAREAMRLRRQIGDEDGALRALAILEELTGEQVFGVETQGIAEDGWTLQKESQIIVRNESTSRLLRFLRIGFLTTVPNMPVRVTVRRGTAITEFEFAGPGFEHLELNLEPGETKIVSVTTNSLFRLAEDGRMVGILLELVEGAGTAMVQTSGVTPDGWTFDGAPGLIQVMNASKEPLFKYLELSYYLQTPSMPTVVRVVEDCTGRVMSFSEPRFQMIEIPIPAAGVRQLEITTDKYFSTTKDRRKLGVHVKMPVSTEIIGIETIGMADDGWTLGNGSARLILRNRGKEREVVNVEFGYFSSNSSLPITVSVGGLCYERAFNFTGAQNERFFFMVESQMSKSLRVLCDETFTSVDDVRNLGVHVRVVDAAPTDEVVTRGLYSDGWTRVVRPARVTIRNISEAEIRYRLALTHWMHNPEMPITVTVKELGQVEETNFVFEGARVWELDLAVGPGRESTWEISSDKFFQAEGDGRRIGVNVSLHKRDLNP